ncbi:MAG: 2-oxo acid dehydrogenase subunit E2 [Chloroflexi bacterium]|nr:2-oxo acid dehydrogenase subunit E2 [Chloroflexota bacterium]
MPTQILMPQLGMDMTEGRIARWLVADGASVQRGDEILEIETDKVTHVVEAPAAGWLCRTAGEGASVAVGNAVGYVLTPSEPPPGFAPRLAQEVTRADTSPAVATPPGRPSGEVTASPIARRLAAQHRIDLASLRGSGPGGRVVEADVLAAVRAAQSLEGRERKLLRRLPLSGRRRIIAERMMASLASSAQLTIMREVEAGQLVGAREALLARTAELGVSVSYDALLAKILATALVEQPMLNATVERDEIAIFAEVHVAVAIAVEDGLVVPVVRNVESRSLAEVARAIDDFARRAGQGSLLPDELGGGTVTITNLGMFGVDSFTPILNPPQSAILGVGRVSPRPVAVNGDPVVRPTVQLSLTWDHRVADGTTAARLLERVTQLIADGEYLAGLAR